MATVVMVALVSWFIVAPDKRSLAFSRGLWGAVKGFVGAGQSTSTPGKEKTQAGVSGTSGSRWAGIRDGWRDGVRAARVRRSQGKDVWSWSCWAATHGARAAGRAWGGAQNIHAGVRRIRPDIAAWRARRAEKKGGPTVEGEVIDDEPTTEQQTAGGNHDQADDEMDIVEGEVVEGEVVEGEVVDDTADHTDSQAGDTKSVDLVKAPEGDAPPAEGAGGARTTTTTTPAQAGKENLMSISTTELESLDAVEAEVAKAMQMCAAMAETFEAAKDWGNGLEDRWSGANWGTDALNQAVAQIPDAIAALGDVEALVSALEQIRAAVEKARNFGDQVATEGVYGDTAAFVAA